MNKKLLAVVLSSVVSVSAFAAQPAPIGQGTVLKSIGNTFPADKDKAICQYMPGKGKRLQAIKCNFWTKGASENAAGDNIYHAVTVTSRMPGPNFRDNSIVRLASVSANTMAYDKRGGLCDQVDFEGEKDGAFDLQLDDCHTKTKSANSAVNNEDVDITIKSILDGDKVTPLAVGNFKHEIEDHDSTPHTGKVKSYVSYKIKRSVSEANRVKHSVKLAEYDNGGVYKVAK